MPCFSGPKTHQGNSVSRNSSDFSFMGLCQTGIWKPPNSWYCWFPLKRPRSACFFVQLKHVHHQPWSLRDIKVPYISNPSFHTRAHATDYPGCLQPGSRGPTQRWWLISRYLCTNAAQCSSGKRGNEETQTMPNETHIQVFKAQGTMPSCQADHDKPC